MGSLLPTHAQTVIIGPVIINSGIVGCSTAYHLVEPMWKDVLALEPTQIFSDDLRAKTVKLNAISEAGRKNKNTHLTNL